MIEFIGVDSSGKNVGFNFEEIGTIYPGDDIVYIRGNPVQISSIEAVNALSDQPFLIPTKNTGNKH